MQRSHSISGWKKSLFVFGQIRCTRWALSCIARVGYPPLVTGRHNNGPDPGERNPGVQEIASMGSSGTEPELYTLSSLVGVSGGGDPRRQRSKDDT